MATEDKKISELEVGAPVAGDFFVFARGTVANYKVEWTALGDHQALLNLDAADQHPIGAITGLQAALDTKVESQSSEGGGADLVLPKVGVDLRLRSLVSGDGSVVFGEEPDGTLDIRATGAGGGEANRGENIGVGAGIYAGMSGFNLTMRSLFSSDGTVTIVPGANEIDLRASPGGGSSPLTSRGDIYTRSASADARLPVGDVGDILVPNPATSTGLEWIPDPADKGSYDEVQDNGSPVSAPPNPRARLNFIPGANVTLNITDQPGTDATDIQISAVDSIGISPGSPFTQRYVAIVEDGNPGSEAIQTARGEPVWLADGLRMQSDLWFNANVEDDDTSRARIGPGQDGGKFGGVFGWFAGNPGSFERTSGSLALWGSQVELEASTIQMATALRTSSTIGANVLVDRTGQLLTTPNAATWQTGLAESSSTFNLPEGPDVGPLSTWVEFTDLTVTLTEASSDAIAQVSVYTFQNSVTNEGEIEFVLDTPGQGATGPSGGAGVVLNVNKGFDRRLTFRIPLGAVTGVEVYSLYARRFSRSSVSPYTVTFNGGFDPGNSEHSLIVFEPAGGGGGGGQNNTSSTAGLPLNPNEADINLAKDGVDLPKRKLVGGTGMTLSQDATSITFDVAPAYDTIEEDDTPVAQETVLNFGSGLTASAGTGKTNVVVDETEVDHDALLNFVLDEHVAHSGVDIIAGGGLTGGGTIDTSRTLNVGSGSGISVLADSIAVDEGQVNHNNLLNYASNEHINHASVSVTGGTSLTGGGAITAPQVLTLLNDADAPGPNQVYGTDGAGAKGWKADPAGGDGDMVAPGVIPAGNLYEAGATPQDAEDSGVATANLALLDAVNVYTGGVQSIIPSAAVAAILRLIGNTGQDAYISLRPEGGGQSNRNMRLKASAGAYQVVSEDAAGAEIQAVLSLALGTGNLVIVGGITQQGTTGNVMANNQSKTIAADTGFTGTNLNIDVGGGSWTPDSADGQWATWTGVGGTVNVGVPAGLCAPVDVVIDIDSFTPVLTGWVVPVATPTSGTHRCVFSSNGSVHVANWLSA